MSLDRSKLIGAKRLSGKTTAQCPICASAGQDSSKEHLVIFDTGKFGCVVDQSPEHSRAIWQAVGAGATGDVTFEPPDPQIEIERTWPADILTKLIQDTTYWNKRGISDETLAPFKGGVATTGQLASRYVFPIFNDSSQIIGFNGRRIDGQIEKKWKLIGPSSHFVWGGLEDIGERVVLTESIGDSLFLRQHGVPETLCLFGLNMSQAVLGHLISCNPKRIIVSTNSDATGAGQRAAIKIKTTLSKFFNEETIVVVHPVAKDWGESSKEQIEQAFLENSS